MPRTVQITPGLRPGSSARLDADAKAKSLRPSTLLRLAIEKTWPGTPGPRALPAVDTTERCPEGHWVQRVTSISPASLAQIEEDVKRLRLPRRVALIRAVIEQTYPPE